MDQTSLENQEIGQSEGEGMQQNNISQHENNENGTDFKENGIDQPIRQEESEGSSSRSKKSSPVDTYTDMFPSLPTSSSKPTTTQITWIKPAIKPRDSTETLTIIPEELRPSGIGTKSHSEICKTIMKETGTEIEISKLKNGSMNILIRGKTENIQNAKKKIAASLSKQFEIKIDIPKEYLSSLIGKAGSNLKALQNKTGAKINVSKGDESIIVISGDKTAAEAARREVKQFLDEKRNFLKETMTIEEQYQPFVYGPHNENMKRISLETGAKIHVPPTDSNEKELVILGQKDEVARAYQEIQNIYAEKKRTIKSVSVSVNKKQHRFVIGQKGANLIEIFQQTGCNVQVPPANDPSDNIVISGDETQILGALKLVLDKASSVCIEEIAIDGALLQRYIRLKGKQRLKDLEKDHKEVTINIGPTNIDIQGPQQDVTVARKAVTEILAQYRKLKLEEIEIEPELRKFVIGKNGQSLKKIKTDFDVDVFFPFDDDTHTSILLAGEKSKVHAAREFINKLTKEMAKMAVLEFKVDTRFLKNIVGKKGETLKKLNEEYDQVYIKIPTAESNSDIVVLRGPKEDIEKLKTYIVQTLEAAKHHEIMHSYTEEIVIEKNVVKYIVGKSGSAINRLKDQYDVKIEIEKTPEDSSEDSLEKEKEKEKGEKKKKGKETEETTTQGKDKDKEKEKKKESKDETGPVKITIQGLKKNVEQAKVAILERAKDFTEGGGMSTIELKIEQKFHGNLIGASGKNVKSLMERYSVNIHFPRNDTESDIVVINGMKRGVDKAKAEMLELFEYEKSINHTAEVTCDNSLLKKIVIGHKMRFIEICDETKTRAEFENNDTSSNKLIIKGSESNVSKAKKLIQDYINELKNTKEEELEIDPMYFGSLIGYKGMKIRELSEKFNVEIKFPNDRDQKEKKKSIVKIRGLPEGIESAKASLLADIKEINQQKASVPEDTCIIQRHFHARLRNPAKAIASDLRVKILFPKPSDPEEKQDEILVKGDEFNVKRAIELLKENVEEEKDVEVAQNLHKSMFGRARELALFYDAHIIFPKQSASSTVKIVARPDIIEQVEKSLLELAEQVNNTPSDAPKSQQDHITETISFNPVFIGGILGKNGSVIKNISELSDARIKVNKEKGTLTISGSRPGVEFAKNEFLEIIHKLEENHIETIQIDPRYISYIRNNELMNTEQDFMVSIKLPRGFHERDVIIQGLKEDCEAAAEYLQTVVKEIQLEKSFSENGAKQKKEPTRSKNSEKIHNDAFFAPLPQTSSNPPPNSVWGNSKNN